MRNLKTKTVLLLIFCASAVTGYSQPCSVLDKWREVKPVYSSITNKPDTNYYQAWNEAGNYGLVASNGQLIIPLNYDNDFMLTGTSAIVKKREKGLVELWNLTSKTKVKLPCTSAGDEVGTNGLIAVCANNKWGYCNSKGKMVLPYKYGYAQQFVHNKAVVEIGGKYGVIDAKGVLLIKPKYHELTAIGDNLLLAKIDDPKKEETYSGLIDYTGKVIVPVIYTDYLMRDGIVEFRKEKGKSILYNYNGRQLTDENVSIPTNGEKRLYVEGGRIAVVAQDNKWFVIDTLGKKFLEGRYYFLYNPPSQLNSQPTDVYIFATKPDEDVNYGVVKLDGTVLLPDVYKDVIAVTENRFLTKKPGEGKKYSLIGADGKEVAADICDVALDFCRHYLIAKKDGKVGVFNGITGEVVIPFTYSGKGYHNNCYINLLQGNVTDTYGPDFKKVKL